MSPTEAFSRDYAAALRRHVIENNETCLHQAYVLGRRALSGVLGVLDIATVHHDALIHLIEDDLHAAIDVKTRLERAAAFLAECLSPFEMTLLGVREANVRLTTLNAELEAANAETRSAHDELKAEIAERLRAEEALRQTQQLQAIGRLAGGVAHHFNNLLTVVLGNLEIARERAAGQDKLIEKLSRASDAARRAATVTRQLLSFSGQQMLTTDIYESAVRLPAFVSLLGGSLGGAIAVESQIPADLWPARVDANELELAILNLAINARDAMPQGGQLLVAASNRHLEDATLGLDGDYVVIEVTDRGSGIPAHILSKVFEPFFTTKEIGAGTGLGLSQVHGFVRQSKGAVDIDSTPGQGTTVRLFIPAVAASSESVEAKKATPTQGVVLVVEDDPDVAEIATAMLEDCGFEVKLAVNAQAALDRLSEGEVVDLVFTDIVMPGPLNGIDLAERVRREFPNIPVLLATGYSDKIRDLTAKGLQVIAKPYQAAELRERVFALLAA